MVAFLSGTLLTVAAPRTATRHCTIKANTGLRLQHPLQTTIDDDDDEDDGDEDEDGKDGEGDSGDGGDGDDGDDGDRDRDGDDGVAQHHLSGLEKNRKSQSCRLCFERLGQREKGQGESDLAFQCKNSC